MQEKDDIRDELKKEAPFLAGMQKKDSFSPPEDYFEWFPSELQNKINKRQMHAVPVAVVLWKQWTSAFAVVIIGMVLAVLLINKPVDTDTVILTNGAEPELWLDELDENTLIAAYEEQMAISDGPIEDYVIENIEEEILLEEL